MDIGTIIGGLNALGGLFGANDPIPMTPAQAEEKPKKAQQPMNTFVILPNQTPPMGIGVPPAPLPLFPPYDWNRVPPTNMLRDLILSMPTSKRSVPKFTRDIPHNAVDMPMLGVPPNMFFPTFSPIPSLRELYELYFGTRL